MKTDDAMNILNVQGTISQDEIKQAYKKASIKYHPDKNPGGLEMMQVINQAYEFLKEIGDSVSMSGEAKAYDYGDELNKVINQLVQIPGIELEVCGNWVWITGDTKPHKDILGKKEGGIGCRYAKKKRAWYYRPEEYKSNARKSSSMDEIRQRHGSQSIGNTQRRLAA